MIKLELSEIRSAAMVGVERHLQCIDRETKVGFPWQAHIEGACAESAFAKMTGVYWDHSVGTFGSRPDVGIYQVRHTSLPDGGLKCYEKDKDTDPFVLMVGNSMMGFEFVGWAYGYEVKERGKQVRVGEYVLARDGLRDWTTLPGETK